MQNISIIVFFILLSSATVAQKVKWSEKETSLQSILLTDTKSDETITIEWKDKSLLILVFLSPDCPLSKNYAPLLNEYQAQYAEAKVYGIIPGASYDDTSINELVALYSLQYPVLKDPKQELTSLLKATTTPEVFLFNEAGDLIYNGAIDDWAVSLGKKRSKAGRFYLQDAITNTLNSLPVPLTYMKPVGCLINEY